MIVSPRLSSGFHPGCLAFALRSASSPATVFSIASSCIAVLGSSSHPCAALRLSISAPTASEMITHRIGASGSPSGPSFCRTFSVGCTFDTIHRSVQTGFLVAARNLSTSDPVTATSCPCLVRPRALHWMAISLPSRPLATMSTPSSAARERSPMVFSRSGQPAHSQACSICHSVRCGATSRVSVSSHLPSPASSLRSRMMSCAFPRSPPFRSVCTSFPPVSFAHNRFSAGPTTATKGNYIRKSQFQRSSVGVLDNVDEL